MKSHGPDAKIFDDLARVAGGAVNILSGLQQQIRDDVRSRFEDMATRMDLVPRADLERAEARIARLEKDVAALMNRPGRKDGGSDPARKATARSAAKKRGTAKAQKKKS